MLRSITHWLKPTRAFLPTNVNRLFRSPDLHIIQRPEGLYICAGPLQILVHSGGESAGAVKRIQRQEELRLVEEQIVQMDDAA